MTSETVTQSVALSSTQDPAIFILFNHDGKATPAGIYTLSVVEDDLLHLKNFEGQTPSASLHIAVTTQVLPPAKPPRPPQQL